MAFSNYSSLFKSGLLSEGSSPSCASAPWATEYCGPRRGSLPSIDALTEITDISMHLPLPPSSSGHDTFESLTSEESLYFTFKKKRNHVEHRSFLSLDLAESQSLQSVSLKGKENVVVLNERQPARSSILSPSFNHSFMPMFSPPAPMSPPGSPISAHSIPDPTRSIISEPSASSSQYPTSVIHAPSPRRTSSAFPTSPSLPRRDLSPMRFADPSPPPLDVVSSQTNDVFSEKSIMSADVLSRSSTVSSGYRRAQRGDALKRLEGRGADGAVGRLKPRLSQNFMHLSDDEDEESTSWSAGKSMNVIVEDLMETSEEHSRHSSKSKVSKNRSLSVSISGQPWYNRTPRQNAWGVLFGGEVDGDIDTEVDKIFGLDIIQHQLDSPQSDDSCASPRPKRSKRSNSPRPRQESAIPLPLPKRASTQSPAHLHPLAPSASTSTSSASSFTRPFPHAKSTARSLGTPNPRIRPRTVSDFGSSSPHTLVHEGRTRVGPRPLQSRLPARLELRLDWLPIEEPSFIDMRDESLESESRTDSWRSLFEVSCAAA